LIQRAEPHLELRGVRGGLPRRVVGEQALRALGGVRALGGGGALQRRRLRRGCRFAGQAGGGALRALRGVAPQVEFKRQNFETGFSLDRF
jgi:hypothetical protein